MNYNEQYSEPRREKFRARGVQLYILTRYFNFAQCCKNMNNFPLVFFFAWISKRNEEENFPSEMVISLELLRCVNFESFVVFHLIGISISCTSLMMDVGGFPSSWNHCNIAFALSRWNMHKFLRKCDNVAMRTLVSERRY